MPVVAIAVFATIGCYEQVTGGVDTEDIKKRVVDSSRTFQTNHDSDRRDEIRMLYPRTEIGWTEAEVREFLGDPAPGVSTEEKWVYDLGGRDSLTLYFREGVLETKHWLQMPEEIKVPPPVAKSEPEEKEQEAVTDSRGQTAGPSVSTGTSR